jgi:hypothetical protein
MRDRRSTISVLLAVLLSASCATSAPSPRLEQLGSVSSAPQPGSRHLVVHGFGQAPFTVAETRKALEAHKFIAFQLSEIPQAPQLEVVMTVVTYACAVKPGLPQGQTRVLINNRPVAQWSFAYADQGKSYQTTIDIDPTLLRIGENRLEVIGYRCSYGNFEVVRFHGIALAAKGS